MGETTTAHDVPPCESAKASDEPSAFFNFGRPALQTASRLMSLPGELRNRIYEYTFKHGNKLNLAFLFTCRLVCLEANVLAAQSLSITVKVRKSHTDRTQYRPSAFFHGDPEAIPLQYRGTIDTVVIEQYGGYEPHALRLCAHYKLFPTHVVYALSKEPCSCGSPEKHFRALRRNAGKSSAMGDLDNWDDPWAIYVEFGAFLLNPRLRSYTIKWISHGGVKEFSLRAEREKADASPMKPATAVAEHDCSGELHTSRWLSHLELNVVEEKRNRMFVVLIKHENLPEQEAIRVRFTIHGGTDGKGFWGQ